MAQINRYKCTITRHLIQGSILGMRTHTRSEVCKFKLKFESPCFSQVLLSQLMENNTMMTDIPIILIH
jgi:hypothetical protein